MAEGVLRVKAHHFISASAGTHSYHLQEPPDPRAILCAQKRGYDITSQRAQKFSIRHFDDFDYVFALDQGHLNILSNLGQGRREPVIRLLPCGEVPDPYYGSMKDFDHALDLIESGIVSFLKETGVPERI